MAALTRRAAEAARAGAVDLWARLSANVAGERERWPLWLPVALGAGTALYFLLPAEPPLWPGPAGLVAGLALAAAGARATRRGGRGGSALTAAGLAAALVAAGLTAAKVRTLEVAAPVLEGRLGPAEVRGRVVHLEALAKGARAVLDRVSIPGLAPDDTPERVRVRLPGSSPRLAAGDRIAVRAILRPPPGPAAPGAFDFQRHAFFLRLGAVGFAIGPARVLAPAPARTQARTRAPPAEADAGGAVSRGGPDIRGGAEAGLGEGADAEADAEAEAEAEDTGEDWRLWLPGLRQRLAARIRAAVGGAEGAVAAALMTGERGAIPEPVLAAMRDSGLAHLLAISGLHIGLVAGILFFSLRALMALIPRVALRFPIKKWAAAAALLGAFAYLAVTGATVPTQRAFVMVALVLAAVMVDRTAISMRIVAWAALLVLVLGPESLLGASFQLSFAAVVALVAVYEGAAGRAAAGGAPVPWRRDGDRDPSWRGRAAVYLGMVALTTVVASLATAPFVIYHFNRFAAYALPANLAAVPLTALWVMPWAMVAFLLMPFGLEGLALAPMGWGLGVLIAVARTVAAWPAAVSPVPAMPTFGIGLVTVGGLWLCLWRRRWRLLGLAAVAAGLATVPLARPPDVLVDGDAKVMAVRGAEGLLLSSGRAGRFRAETWLRRAGQREPRVWPDEGATADGRLACDRLGCVYRAGGQTVALVRDGRALSDDCRLASVLVSVVPVRRPCPGPSPVIDRFDLWREGGHAIWLRPGGVGVQSVRAWQGERPWVPKRGR